MSKFGWFGFRTVTRPRVGQPPIWHGFKTNVVGSPSLCGRVTFGPSRERRGGPRGRACVVCSAIWEKKYPPRGTLPQVAEDAWTDGFMRGLLSGRSEAVVR